MRGHMFLCLSQIWFNKARTNIGLSPTMGFLNASDSLAQFWLYLALLGESLSDLSFTVGFFKSLSFSHY